MNNYWAQFDTEEKRSMHGMDLLENEEELDGGAYQDDDQSDCQIDRDTCPRCTIGCNYCLMLGY